MIKRKETISRFRIWESLLDVSGYFALAGLKLKGYSEKESLKLLRKNWIKSFQEHQQANLDIIKRLYAQRNKNK